jgi:hypothetical protein
VADDGGLETGLDIPSASVAVQEGLVACFGCGRIKDCANCLTSITTVTWQVKAVLASSMVGDTAGLGDGNELWVAREHRHSFCGSSSS